MSEEEMRLRAMAIVYPTLAGQVPIERIMENAEWLIEWARSGK